MQMQLSTSKYVHISVCMCKVFTICWTEVQPLLSAHTAYLSAQLTLETSQSACSALKRSNCSERECVSTTTCWPEICTHHIWNTTCNSPHPLYVCVFPLTHPTVPTCRYAYVRTFTHERGMHRQNWMCEAVNLQHENTWIPLSLMFHTFHRPKPLYSYLCSAWARWLKWAAALYACKHNSLLLWDVGLHTHCAIVWQLTSLPALPAATSRLSPVSPLPQPALPH